MRLKRLTATTVFLAINMLALDSAIAENIDNLPPEKMQGSTSYVTGGVGHDEASAIRQAKSMYPLSLEFVQHAKPKDEFLANVEVTIKNKAGDIALQVITEGPFLLARLAPGKYTVSAKIKEEQRTRQVTVAEKKPTNVIFEWK